MFLESLMNSSPWLLAQAAASSGWIHALLEIEKDKLVLLLLFGTGFVSVLGYSIAKILKALNGSPDEVDDLKAQIEELEQRVASLERIVQQQTSVV